MGITSLSGMSSIDVNMRWCFSRSHDGSAANDATINWLRISPDAVDARGHAIEIEEDVVAELTRRHQAWIDGPQPRPLG